VNLGKPVTFAYPAECANVPFALSFGLVAAPSSLAYFARTAATLSFTVPHVTPRAPNVLSSPTGFSSASLDRQQSLPSPDVTLYSTLVYHHIHLHTIANRATVIMKHVQVLWLLASGAGAIVLQRKGLPNYPGIQFGQNRKLSITVFSDLHFGERKSLQLLNTRELPANDSQRTL
jgi:hypothetical protein